MNDSSLDNINETTPLVSVVVLAYNHQDYIKECLDGILTQQTNFKYEIILGEDESNDGTREICKVYAEKFPDKIRLFLRSRKDVIYINNNPTGRFNFIESLKVARGTFIALCEGDDYWINPLKLQMQVDLLESNPNLIACHHWQKISKKVDGEFVVMEAPKKDHGFFSEKTASIDKVFSNHLRLKTRTLMFRNKINENFFPEWIKSVAFADVPLSFILGKYGDFGFIDKEMAVYRLTEGGVSKAGLKDLGARAFRIKHLKNWIEIWDRADILYNYKHHKLASKTVSSFYKRMLDDLSNSPKSLFYCLIFNVRRKLPINKSFKSAIDINRLYLKKLFVRFNNKKLKS